jgi:hypothetical protein
MLTRLQYCVASQEKLAMTPTLTAHTSVQCLQPTGQEVIEAQPFLDLLHSMSGLTQHIAQ